MCGKNTRFENKKVALSGDNSGFIPILVRERGLEPPRLSAHAPKACVSTIPPLAQVMTEILYQPLSKKRRT